jgi:hypothetical protein
LDTIGISTFGWNNKLQEINLSADNKSYTLIDGVLFSKDKTRMVLYPNAKGDSYDIPEGTTIIDHSAFSNHVTTVKFPSTIKIIDYCSFLCSSIKKAELNEGLVTIREDAFDSSDQLESVTLPSTLTSIGKYAFDNDTSLTTINCKIVTPLVIDATVFENVKKSKCKLYVPKGSVDAYKAAPVWKDFIILETLDGVDNVNAAKTVAGVKYVNAAGLQSSKPFEGVNVVVTTYTDGTTSVAKQIKH